MSEEDAIRVAIDLAEQHGYGRMIQILEGAWSRKLQLSGQSRQSADMAAGIVCVWCHVDSRTGKSMEAKGD